MDETRANPDELLRAIRKEDSAKKRGHFKIFFGYAAGVGKTYAMLKAAHAAKRHGIDVVAGYIEPHARPQTAALLSGLEALPVKQIPHNNIMLNEFDLDAAIQRKPQLVLVDELAHSNAPGCRHSKRYQDVEELLKAGIDVYTTVNVQHIESLNDMVAAITGVMVKERIPDRVFDSADQVKLVDIEPQELIERMTAGQIYAKPQAQKALDSFFSAENLTALRELALRRCADRMNKLSENARIKNNSDYYTDEHILVCLSSSPSNQKIIRTAARMAHAFQGSFTALFVETPDFPTMSEDNKNRLRANIRLATQLGATIETVYGDDAAFQISEFARLSGVSKIVVGRNNARRKHIFSQPSLTEKLISYAPNLDVYIIPDKETALYKAKRARYNKSGSVLPDVCKSVLVLLLATLIGTVFLRLGFSEANIITIYILGVLVTAVITTQRAYSLVSSVVSVLVFNFFFTDPRFTLNAYDSGYPATFLIMFASAFLTSSLAVKIKQHARRAAATAFRTQVLFDTNQLLQKAKEKKTSFPSPPTSSSSCLGRTSYSIPLKTVSFRSHSFFPPRSRRSGRTTPRKTNRRLRPGFSKTTSTRARRRIPCLTPNACIWPSGSMKPFTALWALLQAALPWTPLKTALCFPFWVNAPSPWKTKKPPETRNRPQFWQKTSSSGPICCAPSPTTCARL